MNEEMREVNKRLHEANAQLDHLLEVFGDTLAKRQGYKSVSGLEAIHLYLIDKHHWLPRDVLSMSFHDIRFALSEELHGWTLPPA